MLKTHYPPVGLIANFLLPKSHSIPPTKKKKNQQHLHTYICNHTHTHTFLITTGALTIPSDVTHTLLLQVLVGKQLVDVRSACVHIAVLEHTGIQKCIQFGTCTYMYLKHTHTHTHACMHACNHNTHVHACTHTHTHKLRNTHTQIKKHTHTHK